MKEVLIKLLKNKITLISIIVLVMFILMIAFAPLIAPYDPSSQSSQKYTGPSNEHIFGTDMYGRDVFSRVIFGTRISLVIGICSVVIGGTIGSILGVLAGYYGGWLDQVIMRITDFMMSFPSVLIGVIVLVILGQGAYKVTIAIGLAFIPRFIRLTRGDTLAIKDQEYIEAIKALGASTPRIIIKHIFPNILNSIIVMSSLWVASGIRLEAALSFLGLGAQPPTPSWGLMLKEGMNAILFTGWLSFFPGLMIFVSIMSVNLIGDGLRDILDPKKK